MKDINYNFSESEIIKLKQLRDDQCDNRLNYRITALILLAKSLSKVEISEILGKSIRTIGRWFEQYLKEGIGSLTHYNYKTKKPYLNFYQMNQLKIYVTFENPATAKQVTHYIKEHFGITYSINGTRKILKKLRLKLMRCKTIPGNAPSVEVQEQFIKKYIALREVNSVTLFGDGMHLIHQNIPILCWGDPLFPPIIETNTSRKRLNILGAYNPDDNSFLHISGEENCNAKRVIEWLELISNTYANASKINLIVDNAKYFHASIVREWLDNNNINMIYLPPYAPNLNLIERFWKYAKKKLVRNQYYKTYKEFRGKTFKFLNNIKDHYPALKKLMVENFQIVRATIMP